MEPFVNLDDERRAYPPGSVHRADKVKWNHVAVWTFVALSGAVTAYGLVRMAIVLWHALTLHLGF